jgi:hypothetical protein
MTHTATANGFAMPAAVTTEDVWVRAALKGGARAADIRHVFTTIEREATALGYDAANAMYFARGAVSLLRRSLDAIKSGAKSDADHDNAVRFALETSRGLMTGDR